MALVRGGPKGATIDWWPDLYGGPLEIQSETISQAGAFMKHRDNKLAMRVRWTANSPTNRAANTSTAPKNFILTAGVTSKMFVKLRKH